MIMFVQRKKGIWEKVNVSDNKDGKKFEYRPVKTSSFEKENGFSKKMADSWGLVIDSLTEN
jgi:hypothetical protein